MLKRALAFVTLLALATLGMATARASELSDAKRGGGVGDGVQRPVGPLEIPYFEGGSAKRGGGVGDGGSFVKMYFTLEARYFEYFHPAFDHSVLGPKWDLDAFHDAIRDDNVVVVDSAAHRAGATDATIPGRKAKRIYLDETLWMGRIFSGAPIRKYVCEELLAALDTPDPKRECAIFLTQHTFPRTPSLYLGWELKKLLTSPDARLPQGCSARYEGYEYATNGVIKISDGSKTIDLDLSAIRGFSVKVSGAGDPGRRPGISMTRIEIDGNTKVAIHYQTSDLAVLSLKVEKSGWSSSEKIDCSRPAVVGAGIETDRQLVVRHFTELAAKFVASYVRHEQNPPSEEELALQRKLEAAIKPENIEAVDEELKDINGSLVHARVLPPEQAPQDAVKRIYLSTPTWAKWIKSSRPTHLLVCHELFRAAGKNDDEFRICGDTFGQMLLEDPELSKLNRGGGSLDGRIGDLIRFFVDWEGSAPGGCRFEKSPEGESLVIRGNDRVATVLDGDMELTVRESGWKRSWFKHEYSPPHSTYSGTNRVELQAKVPARGLTLDLGIKFHTNDMGGMFDQRGLFDEPLLLSLKAAQNTPATQSLSCK